ncbi:hypothetical protein [Lentzea sp. NPDC051838]|uniref:hypothetical protein n=1 Tax=Lentzea sp. NPDC051838 TaxID=3154849 RepID=UPI00341F4615
MADDPTGDDMTINDDPMLTPQADNGPGNLAWHSLRTCGRESPSATFRLMVIESDE